MILPRLVHHVYSKHAEVTVPSLDDWEKGWKEKLKAETLPVVFIAVPNRVVSFLKVDIRRRTFGNKRLSAEFQC